MFLFFSLNFYGLSPLFCSDSEFIVVVIIIIGFDPIGPLLLLHLVKPSLHWSSKNSTSLWMVLSHLFMFSSVLHSL